MTSEPITIVLLGEPIANARHRTGQGHAYTPAKTANERTRLKLAAQQVMLQASARPFEGALQVIHRVERPIPKSFSKKKRLAALTRELLPTPRPDFDNYSKMVDALTGIAWRDDSQICHYNFTKVYSEQPKIIIQITPM